MNSRHDTPWAGRDLVVVVVLNLVGVGAIVGGWLWASGRTVLADQFAGANLTVGGLIVAGAGNIVWLLSGRRAVGRAKVALFGSLGDQA